MTQPKGKVATIAVLLLAACGLALLVRFRSANTSDNTAQPVLVAAAASLRPPLDELADLFAHHRLGPRPRITYGSSGMLAEQILQGAPFDVFVSADLHHARRVQQQAGRQPLVTVAYGVLILWTRNGNAPQIGERIEAGDAGALRIAVPNPQYAPYGRAAQEFLERCQAWQPEQLVLTANVGQAAHYAVRGLVDAAFLSLSYGRSARMRADGSYWIVPTDCYSPLAQTAVVLSERPAASRLVRWLQSEAARAVWSRYGYRMPEQAGPAPHGAADRGDRSDDTRADQVDRTP